MNEAGWGIVITPELGCVCRSNCLEYLAKAPFFDEDSDNYKLKMEGFRDPTTIEAHLGDNTMNGIQYVVNYPPRGQEQSQMFVIQKHKRESKDVIKVLGFYYILNDQIFAAPDLESVFKARVATCFNHLSKAAYLVEKCIEFDPFQGHQWKISKAAYAAPELNTTIEKKKRRERDGIVDDFLNIWRKKENYISLSTLPKPSPASSIR
eukprot:TRINITY_DN6560_c0_g1_i1.p1 TRINITY_DN6560_c0_g1~~TRINITY_DN6560_c0_g1_i1.p1  ORF type:complete len:207 (+),score=33.34 TRINITY_DN6560_c0_g1_i1:101-721(+)